MNMQTFYRRLSIKPSRAHQRRLIRLTQISKEQVLNATGDIEWYVWRAETPNV
jgi:hypothetical protein